MPEEREGKADDDPWLARDAAAPATAAVSTRKGGFERPVQQKVCGALVCLCLLSVQLIPLSLAQNYLCFLSVCIFCVFVSYCIVVVLL